MGGGRGVEVVYASTRKEQKSSALTVTRRELWRMMPMRTYLRRALGAGADRQPTSRFTKRLRRFAGTQRRAETSGRHPPLWWYSAARPAPVG